jgi:uncharacterized sporulation protein YeaH/YhbH (DUF444 family)
LHDVSSELSSQTGEKRHALTYIQVIQPDEAKRDWGGERANKVERLQHAIAADRRDLDNAQVDVEDLNAIDSDDLTEEDIDDLREAIKRLEQAKQVSFLVFGNLTC